jgi:hypothetical protein
MSSLNGSEPRIIKSLSSIVPQQNYWSTPHHMPIIHNWMEIIPEIPLKVQLVTADQQTDKPYKPLIHLKALVLCPTIISHNDTCFFRISRIVYP